MSGWMGHCDFMGLGGSGKEVMGKVCSGSLVLTVGIFPQHIQRLKAQDLAISCAQVLFISVLPGIFLLIPEVLTQLFLQWRLSQLSQAELVIPQNFVVQVVQSTYHIAQG